MESLNQLISSLAIPHKTGTITRREHASGDVTGLLVCIQDLHANPGVQINEAKIILHLVANYRFSVVLVEGATGQGDLSILCSLPPAIRRRFMRNLMRRAYLTGSEYAGALDPDADFDLWGIDDSHGYRQNWMAAVRTDVVRDKVSHAAASFRSNILRACRPYVSPDLWDLFELRTKFRSGLRDATKSDLAGRLLLYSTAYSVAVPPSIRRWMDLHGEMHANRGRDGQTPLDPLEEPNLPLESFFSDVAKAVAESVGGSDARFDQCFLFLLDAVDLAENAFQLNLQRPEAMRFLAFDARRLRDRVRDSVTWMNSKISESAEHVEVPPSNRQKAL